MTDIAMYIPVGHKNAISRQQLVMRSGIPDRKIRRAIKESKCLICNLQDGNGYFIPDTTEESLVRAYRAQEQRRSLSVADTVKLCDDWIRRSKRNKEENIQLNIDDLMEGNP